MEKLRYTLILTPTETMFKQVATYINLHGTRDRVSVAMMSSTADTDMDFDQVVHVHSVGGKIEKMEVSPAKLFRDKTIVRFDPAGLTVKQIMEAL